MKLKSCLVGLLIIIGGITIWGKSAVHLQQGSDGYLVEFELPEVETFDVDTFGITARRGYAAETFTRLYVEDYGITEEVGKPELPFYSFYMAIAAKDQAPAIEVVDQVVEKVVTANRIFPAQEPWLKSQTEADRFLSIDRQYYATSGTQAPVAATSETFMIRGVPCASIQINPVAYNPATNELTLTKKLTLKIKTGAKILPRDVNSKVFANLLNYVLANSADAVTPVASRPLPDDYVIITAPKFESNLSEFVNFRKNRFNVKMVTTSQTGSSASQVDSYIQGLNPEPSYVLLVGDVGDIPGSPGSSRLTDLYYSSTDSDYYPEVLLGRFSVASATELSNVVKKTIFMENNLGKIDKVNSWLAGEDRTYWQVAERTHNYCINQYLGEYQNVKFYCHNNSISESAFTKRLNDGVIFNFYSAHGSQTSWGAGDFSLSGTDMKRLTNTTSYGFQYGFCCLSGTYSRGECFTESCIRGKGGSVVAIGSSISTTWTPDENVQKGIFDGIFDSSDPQTSVGASLMAGKMANNSSKKTYFEVYNIMGDAAAEMLPVNIGPFLSVIKPEGGKYYPGDKIAVQWETGGGANVANVKIEYSADSGSTYKTIVASVANNNNYEWTAPDIDESDKCMVKVSAVGGNLIGTSGIFSIMQKAVIALNPGSLTAQAGSNQKVVKDLKIENKGKGKLTYSIAIPGAGAQIMINELYVSVDATYDGLELWNRGADQDMAGYKVVWKDNQNTSGEYTFKDGFTLKSGATVVLMDDNGQTGPNVLYVGSNMYWDQGTTELSVALVNPAGTGLDFVKSAGNNDNPPAGTSWNGGGVALNQDYVYRKGNDDKDSKDDWGAGSSGTPNALNANQSNSGLGYWLSVNTTEGTVNGNQSVTLKVTFDSKGIPNGEHKDNLVITHNSADIQSPTKVACTFKVDANPIINPLSMVTSYGMQYNNTRLFYQIPAMQSNAKQHVSIKLYNVQGKMLRTLVNSHKAPGRYSLALSNRVALASGLYLVKMEVADFSKTLRIVNK